MPRVSVTTQHIDKLLGTVEVLTAPTASNDIIDVGLVELVVNNASGAPITVTCRSNYTQDGLILPNLIVTVAAATTRRIGPFPSRTYQQDVSAPEGAGRVLVDYSAVATVTRCVTSLF